jgi:hypothetical protein
MGVSKNHFGASKKGRLLASEQDGGVDGVSLEVVLDL